MRQTFTTSQPTLSYRPLGTFRFVLALMVLVQHFTNIAPKEFTLLVGPVYPGSLAVVVFFAVSGFVIAEAIEAHYRRRPGAFLINRAIRIYPPLLAAFAIALFSYLMLFKGGTVMHPDARFDTPLSQDILSARSILANLVSFLPLPQGLGSDRFWFISVAWSIRIEFLFYFVMAAALLVPSQLYRPALAGGGALAMLGFFLHLKGIGPQMLQFIPYFVYGVAAYYLLAGHGRARPIALLGLVGCALQAAVLGVPEAPGIVSTSQTTMARHLILAALLLAIPLLATLNAGVFEPLDRALGDLSYPLYLNHCILLPVVRSYVPSLSAEGLIVVTAITVLFSCAMYLAVEPALSGLRDRIRRASIAATPARGPLSVPMQAR
jgi:peptidoglycan/LPS O-acetylase OafA/YrhL